MLLGVFTVSFKFRFCQIAGRYRYLDCQYTRPLSQMLSGVFPTDYVVVLGIVCQYTRPLSQMLSDVFHTDYVVVIAA
jgi:hypothetical protein